MTVEVVLQPTVSSHARLVHDGHLHHVRVDRRFVRVLPSQFDDYVAEYTAGAMT